MRDVEDLLRMYLVENGWMVFEWDEAVAWAHSEQGFVATSLKSAVRSQLNLRKKSLVDLMAERLLNDAI